MKTQNHDLKTKKKLQKNFKMASVSPGEAGSLFFALAFSLFMSSASASSEKDYLPEAGLGDMEVKSRQEFLHPEFGHVGPVELNRLFTQGEMQQETPTYMDDEYSPYFEPRDTRGVGGKVSMFRLKRMSRMRLKKDGQEDDGLDMAKRMTQMRLKKSSNPLFGGSTDKRMTQMRLKKAFNPSSWFNWNAASALPEEQKRSLDSEEEDRISPIKRMSMMRLRRGPSMLRLRRSEGGDEKRMSRFRLKRMTQMRLKREAQTQVHDEEI